MSANNSFEPTPPRGDSIQALGIKTLSGVSKMIYAEIAAISLLLGYLIGASNSPVVGAFITESSDLRDIETDIGEMYKNIR
jgi:hypothetical protein